MQGLLWISLCACWVRHDVEIYRKFRVTTRYTISDLGERVKLKTQIGEPCECGANWRSESEKKSSREKKIKWEKSMVMDGENECPEGIEQ